MNGRTQEKSTMLNRDPNNWQWLVNIMPYLLLSAASFTIGFISVLHNGGPWPKALMSSTVGTILSVSLYPVLLWVSVKYQLPGVSAFAVCVFLAFMGVEWIRNKADDLYEVFIGRWRKK